MIGIFFYRLFWALYDYLGTLTISGLLSALGFWLLGYIFFLLPGVDLLGLSILGVACCWVVYSLAMFLIVGQHIALQKPIHIGTYALPNVAMLKRSLKYSVFGFLGLLVFVTNIYFYARLSAQQSQPWGFFSFILVILFCYLFVCFVAFLMSLFGAASLASPDERFISTMREAVMALSLVPWLWFLGLFLFAILTALAIVSVVGAIFIGPMWCAISSLVFQMSKEFVEKLRVARSELGQPASLKDFRRRAIELMLAEEQRKPPRTWKDIFKPWEY